MQRAVERMGARCGLGLSLIAAIVIGAGYEVQSTQPAGGPVTPATQSAPSTRGASSAPSTNPAQGVVTTSSAPSTTSAPATSSAPSTTSAPTTTSAPATSSAPSTSSAPASGPSGKRRAPPSAGETGITPTLPAQWIDAFRWRCIGPATMGGRITALAVYEKDPCRWWAATASGGLLKTTNDGITFEHQFDHEATVSIGDVAVAPSDPNIVWVGTGENNPRNSVSWGDGVYKSTDGGKTWQHMGLEDSFQIGRIAIHPVKPDTVYVGALGRLWGPNDERGLYKTSDGGKTWEKVLYVDDQTGVIDVQMHPEDPDTLLAATWERARDGFDGNDPQKKWGPGSGLYKTSDAGRTWKKLTQGLPTCKLGRIGIDYYHKDPKNVYVVLEPETIGQEPKDAAYAGLRGEDAEVGAKLTEITKGGPAEKAELKVGDIALRVNGTTVHSYNEFLTEIRKRLAGDTIRLEVSRERKSAFVDLTFTPRPQAEGRGADSRPAEPFGSGLGGQRENYQDQQGPKGYEFGGVYKSTDGGETWTRINSVNPRPMYFSQIRVDPTDDNYLYVLGVDLYRSKDGGKTFTDDGGGDSHPDHHALWINPRDGRHMVLGNDGGLYVTRDRGEKWDHHNHMAIGQFYHVAVDPRRHYMVYGGLQDNGCWGGPSRSRVGAGPINADWFLLGWGDGFVCQVDRNDPDQVYWESQNGGMGRYNLRTAERGFIRPRDQRGGPGGPPASQPGRRAVRYRFNWKTPFILSSHNSRMFYAGGNYVFRSLDRGESLKKISPEISRTKEGSATALAESPLDEDVLYVGTDDGLLWITRDGGHEWTKLVDFTDGKAGVPVSQPASQPVSQPARAAAEPPPRPGAEGGPARLLDRLAELDANGDGKLQRDEVPERMARFFDRLDTNHDGVLDQDELKAMPSRPPGRSPQRSEPQTQPTTASAPATRPAETQPAAGTRPAPDLLSGAWTAHMLGEHVPEGRGEFAMNLKLGAKGEVSGTLDSNMGSGDVLDGRFDAATGNLTFGFDPGEGMNADFSATVRGLRMTGNATVGGGVFSFEFEAEQTKRAPAGAAAEAAGPPGERSGGREGGVQPKSAGASLAEVWPGPRWVSSLEASRFVAGRVYVTLDGHRSDDDEPYALVSEDYGQHWRSIRANLPSAAGSTRVIREDLFNVNILYLGTEFAAWVSVDRGQSWTKLNGNLPTVAVHEFAMHPSSGEIVAATHGRSLWVLDVTPLRQMTADAINAKAYLYKPNSAVYWRPALSRTSGGGARAYIGENPPPGAQIYYSLKEKVQKTRLKITDPAGETICELTADPNPGLHLVTWDLRRPQEEAPQRPGRAGGGRGGPQSRLVPSGKYVVSLTVDRTTLTQDLSVETDPDYPDYRAWEQETPADDSGAAGELPER